MTEKLYLFDFDGVLVDSLGLYQDSLIKTLAAIGRPVVKNRADYLDLFEDNIFAALQARGVDLEEFFRVSLSRRGEIDFESLEPFYPIIPVLQTLSQGNTLLVISSNSSQTISKILKKYDFLDCFAAVLGADFSLSKKDKIAHALALWKTPRERTYYIGDTAGDIKEAKLAGVRAVAVAWGWHDRERLAAADPDYLLTRPEELLQI